MWVFLCVSLNIILFRYSTIFIINPFQISALSQQRSNPRIQKVGERPATPFIDYCGGNYLPTYILLSRGGGGGGGGRKFSIRLPLMCIHFSIFSGRGWRCLERKSRDQAKYCRTNCKSNIQYFENLNVPLSNRMAIKWTTSFMIISFCKLQDEKQNPVIRLGIQAWEAFEDEVKVLRPPLLIDKSSQIRYRSINRHINLLYSMSVLKMPF